MTSDCHHAFDPVNLCCALCGIPLRQARMKNGWELLFSSDKPKDTEMTPCRDCKGTGKYQPLMGPPEPCRTCSPADILGLNDPAYGDVGSGNGGGVGSLEGTRAVPKATETAWTVVRAGKGIIHVMESQHVAEEVAERYNAICGQFPTFEARKIAYRFID